MFFFMIKRFLFFCKLTVMSLYRGPNEKTAPLSARRVVVLFLLSTVGLFMLLTNWICLLLDELLFPSYRKVEIKEPVFILGVPRSGSTLLLRLLAQDQSNFASFKFWEILFAPSIIQRKVWKGIGSLDALLGAPLVAILKKLDKWIFRSSKNIHQVGLFLYEEDGTLFLWIMATFFLFFGYPYLDQFEDLLRFDDEIPEKDKKYIMRYYHRCIQRHLYYHGAHKKLLSKNPTFAPMVRTLQQTFPDAKFLNTVRIPYQQIPSIISFLVYFISQFGGDLLKIPNYKNVVLEVIKVFYENPIFSLKQFSDDQCATILYNDLVSDLDKTVRNLYANFGFSFTTDFEEILNAKVLASKNYKSKHKYSLEQFGLTTDEIWRFYQAIFQEFGFSQYEDNASSSIVRNDNISSSTVRNEVSTTPL